MKSHVRRPSARAQTPSSAGSPLSSAPRWAGMSGMGNAAVQEQMTRSNRDQATQSVLDRVHLSPEAGISSHGNSPAQDAAGFGRVHGLSDAMGPAQGSAGWSFLAGDQKAAPTAEQGLQNKAGPAFGDGFAVIPNRVAGRWADTFQGGRANDAGGGGVHDPGDFSGGRAGWASSDYCEEWGERGAWLGGGIGAYAGGVAGATAGGLINPGVAPYGAMLGVGIGAPAGAAAGNVLASGICEAGVSIGEMKLGDSLLDWLDEALSGDAEKRPQEEDTGGEWAPVMGGNGNQGPIGDSGGGRAGGAGDGRGNPGGGASGGAESMAGKAIGQQLGSLVDAPERALNTSSVSYESMLAEVFHTDPTRQ